MNRKTALWMCDQCLDRSTDQLRVLSNAAILIEIEHILSGIDKTETEQSNGWWETSTGAKYGADKMKQIRNLFK